MNIRNKKIILVIGDLAILFFALYTTLLLRYGINFTGEIWKSHLTPFFILYILWIIIFYIADLYNLNNAKVSFDFYQKLTTTLIICGFFSIAFFYLNPGIKIAPKTTLFLNLIVIALFFSIWRNLFNFLIKSTNKNNFIIIGYSELAHNFAKTVNKNPQLGFNAIAFADLGQLNQNNDAIKFINLENNLQKFIKENNVATIIINSEKNKNLSDRLFQYLPLGINFISFTDFYENLFSIVPIKAINQSWFIENLTEGKKRIFDIAKRFFDIISSLILAIITLPFTPFIIAAIKLTSSGPILFKQVRTGKNEKNFLAIKFRTMVIGAESNGPQWATKNDPRITKIGSFLRKTRLDEIPQLINIIKGEMSLVGPRPERPEFIDILEKDIPFYKQRLLVKPGLTGWAQVNFPYGASKEDAVQKLQYDLYYIKHRSIALDFKIILKTVAIVLGYNGR